MACAPEHLTKIQKHANQHALVFYKEKLMNAILTPQTPPFKRVFSGMQPTGNLHLGNYLGAMLSWIDLQNTSECLYCVVDLHAVTVWQNPIELKEAIRSVTATYIACGLDPKKSIIFNQSQVSGHAELGWIFNCVARLGWLNRMTQFKEKAGKDKEKASAGLYVYPNLMAADILLYHATHVPVGEDQKQHLELTRDIAHKFNLDFSDSIATNGFDPSYFTLPEPLIRGTATRVMSLRDGTKKMSKSDPSDYSRISLTDLSDAIAQKIRKATTDQHAFPSELEGLKSRPEAENLVGIYAALERTTKENVLQQFGGQTFSIFKTALSDVLITRIDPIAKEITRLKSDPTMIDNVLIDGSNRARIIADQTIKEVKDIMGFVR